MVEQTDGQIQFVRVFIFVFFCLYWGIGNSNHIVSPGRRYFTLQM